MSGTSTTYRLLIGDELRSTSLSFPVVNPADGKNFQECPHADKQDVDDAVAAANAAFPDWSATSVKERCERLLAAVEVLKENKEDLAQLLTKEQGKPIAMARGEVDQSVGRILEVVKDTGDEVNGPFAAQELPVDKENKKQTYIERRPIGVVVAISPWNFPLYCSITKWAPAVALGNTCVLKPSPFTPLTTLRLGELFHDAKTFPSGVLNVVSGDDSGAVNDFNVGAHLTNHNDVSAVTFTGSVATGKRVMASCAQGLRRVTLELGGNDAAIVRHDVDVEKTARGVFEGAFFNTGQVCVAIKRVYVHESIFESFKDAIVKCAEQAKGETGDGTKDGVRFGPLCNKMQFDKVQGIVETTRKEGGNILCGGKVMGEGGGYFYEPTIVTGLDDKALLVCEEQFGPVLPLLPYSNDEDAIKRTNNSPYGLGGSVWSADTREGNAIARKIRSGTVWVNRHLSETGGPFGGFKNSGIGREGGSTDAEAYTEIQTISTDLE
eukprot:TRINITY_DN11010_c0_g1_i1.p1 TRINITY_DN11010_c0_g1~~TRINITY_DN11010_c0_g1_i1.p1  ORF type:complete len:528 (+),score=118.41 TRINITY_DN11010_c0_g1_i1:105-1586(+)